ncbi:MAG: hypothetical protein PWR22_1865 [Moorella sp. (in: firmicutes)]|nr:hypothetical protein [Moorella sp. (in: firmicutes)]
MIWYDSFNPHPAWKPGATGGKSGTGHGLCVSILTRHGSRVQRPGSEREYNCLTRFNPHPAWKPGATITPPALFQTGRVSILTRHGSRVQLADTPQPVRRPGFQSSPGMEAGCNGYKPSIRARLGCFNSHPAWKPGATLFVFSALNITQVSILTRHGSRVQHLPPGLYDHHPRFQSSPGMEAGCNVGYSYSIAGLPGFNPHPAWKPGATRDPIGLILTQNVSILTRHGSRVQPQAGLQVLTLLQVSILTRHGSRVQRTIRIGLAAPEAGFNPHPAWKPGATIAPMLSFPNRSGFNPHPAWKPGATLRAFNSGPTWRVSILTRHGSRVQR